MDWFLYDDDLRHESVNRSLRFTYAFIARTELLHRKRYFQKVP